MLSVNAPRKWGQISKIRPLTTLPGGLMPDGPGIWLAPAGVRGECMAFAIKAGIRDPRARSFAFNAQKTMYGGKHIAEGDVVFLFASENEGGRGLIARGVVISAE